MSLTLRPVASEAREILRNLLEKYNYEFSQYDLRDVNALGLYGYSYLDHYWAEQNRWAYFFLVGGVLAGFAMVNGHSDLPDRPIDFALAEFFVLHKYRRCGIGTRAFSQFLTLHRGRWQVKRHPRNLTAAQFWDRAIAKFPVGRYERILAHPELRYDDGSPADIFFFFS